MTSRHRYALLLTTCTFILLMAGATVTSTKSSMAVPDWPLSFGQWMPEMVGGVAWEHGHRMIGALVGVIILGLVGWSWARESSRAVKAIAWAALVGVIIQGVLGGLTVLWGTAHGQDDTHPVMSSVHGVLGMIVFSLVLSYTVVTSAGWTTILDKRVDILSKKSLARPAYFLVVLVFLQIGFGAVIRQFNAGLFIPDFPELQGRLPHFSHWLVGVAFAHRLGAVTVGLVALWLGAKVIRSYPGVDWVRGPARWLAVVVVVQFTLGVYTVISRLDPWIATFHHAGGALVLLFSVVLALRLGRLFGDLDFESRDKSAS